MRLFSEFVQEDASISRRFGGSGLGLAISKRLIEQIGGTISVESPRGAGSCFRFALTLRQAEAPPGAISPRQDIEARFMALARGRTPRILAAEDNPINQFVLRQVLRAFDVQLEIVGDGREAVEMATRFEYDAILMDMNMPDMDGLEATRRIRAGDGASTMVPIVAFTANAFAEDIEACYAAGMNRFVAKPVNKEALLSALLDMMLIPGDSAGGGGSPFQPGQDGSSTLGNSV